MSSVTLNDVQLKLPEILSKLLPGEELFIDRDGKPIAKLTRVQEGPWPCQPGSAAHLPHWMAPDFNETPEEFKEYME